MRRACAFAACVTAALLAGCDWTQSFEVACEQRLPATAIRVGTASGEPQLDFTRSASDLTAMGAASAGRQVLGLTQTQLRWSVAFGSSGMTRRFGGRHCMRPDIEVKLAFEPMTLFVAREQPEGSCAFDITMNHERQHQRIYQRFLLDVAPRLETELRERFGNRVQYYASEAEAEAAVKASVRDYLSPLVDQSMQEVNALQATIDTPEEYFRLETFQRTCS